MCRPKNLIVKAISPLVLHVTWRKASENPVGYQIKYTRKTNPGGTHEETQCLCINPTEDSCLIEDLEPGSVYLVKIVSVSHGELEIPGAPIGGVTVKTRTCIID